jgi:hypothetical protein
MVTVLALVIAMVIMMRLTVILRLLVIDRLLALRFGLNIRWGGGARPLNDFIKLSAVKPDSPAFGAVINFHPLAF